MFHPVRILAASLALVATSAAFASDYVANGAELVKAADWKQLQTVTVQLSEHQFEPSDLKLKAGQPYKIEIKNVGEKDHYYTAPKFFKAVAWRKLMVNKQAEVKAD